MSTSLCAPVGVPKDWEKLELWIKFMANNKFTKIECLVIGLDKLGKLPDSDDEQKRKSLMRWYGRKCFLTSAQRGLAVGLVKAYGEKEKSELERKKKMYLYAITNGESVKLGMSCNIESRLKTLQTSSAQKLKVSWRYFVGYDRNFAMKCEKKLHRFCSRYHQAGEWFYLQCLPLIAEFHVKDSFGEINDPIIPAHMAESVGAYALTK